MTNIHSIYSSTYLSLTNVIDIGEFKLFDKIIESDNIILNIFLTYSHLILNCIIVLMLLKFILNFMSSKPTLNLLYYISIGAVFLNLIILKKFTTLRGDELFILNAFTYAMSAIFIIYLLVTLKNDVIDQVLNSSDIQDFGGTVDKVEGDLKSKGVKSFYQNLKELEGTVKRPTIKKVITMEDIKEASGLTGMTVWWLATISILLIYADDRFYTSYINILIFWWGN